MKITVTRALAELKLLDARIRKEIQELMAIDVYQKRSKRALHTNISVDEFEKKAKANFQKVNDLMNRRKKMKALVLSSNAKIKVKVNDEEFTVSEAIEYKSTIEYESILLKKLRLQFSEKSNQVMTSKAELDQKVETMLIQNLGKEVKADREAWDAIAKPFIEKNELLLTDPLKLSEYIKNLEDRVQTFKTEIDFVLSESNARTEIEIVD